MIPRSNYLLLIIGLCIPFVAKADWGPGPPLIAVLGVSALAVILVFFSCFLVSILLKTLLELFTKRKKRHVWFQAFFMELFVALVVYLEDSKNLLYSIEGTYGYEFRVSVFNYLILAMLLLGWVVGYLVTPYQKNNTTL